MISRANVDTCVTQTPVAPYRYPPTPTSTIGVTAGDAIAGTPRSTAVVRASTCHLAPTSITRATTGAARADCAESVKAARRRSNRADQPAFFATPSICHTLTEFASATIGADFTACSGGGASGTRPRRID